MTKEKYLKTLELFVIVAFVAIILFPCVCFSAGSEAQKVWGETTRPPRENFKPETEQALFDLGKSILKNPSLSVEAKGKLPKFWQGSLRIWKEVYKSPDYFSKMVTIEQDANVSFQGKPSIKINIAPSDEDVYLELYQDISMKDRDLKGKKIRLSFYAYREKPPIGKEFFITGIMFDKEKVIGTTADIHPSIQPGKWLFFSREGVVKPETELFKLSLRFISAGNDTIWLSGFLLEEIQ
ncbi:MAG: hypothetical protein NC907_02785 [Candidatus Omnitrophica bacterium]|nr:hypothetical protein [Candidatus Omnitrophota bacterium]